MVPRGPDPAEGIDPSAAVAAGLTFRTAEQTARDTLACARDHGADDVLDTDAFAARERALLDAWTARG